MICEHCGHSMPDGSLTCDYCGTYLGKYASSAGKETGVRAIRQGRISAHAPTLPSGGSRMREYGDYDLSSVPLENGGREQLHRPVAMYRENVGSSRPSTRRGVPVSGRAPALRSAGGHVSSVRRSHVNWMLIAVIGVVLAMLAAVGYYLYMSRSEGGQRATARRNALAANEAMFALAAQTRDPLVQTEREALLKEWGDVTPQSYWLAGQEYLDVGDVTTAITCFRIGDIVDPENYDGLMLLAGAYELNGQDDLAEELYLRLLTDISPFRSEAYAAVIRLYQEQDRGPEAGEMMLKAYQNTDKENFRLQRKEFLPETPQVNLSAGRYELSKMQDIIRLTSPQGYDIYYTVDDEAELPEGGIFSEDGSIVPKEGTITLRAVCVSGKLVSDPLKVSYTFFYPTPPAPKCNLAPNTYKKLREVELRPGELKIEGIKKKEKAEIESHYEYFYTIDGSTPTVNSPRYDGTPIKLPAGKVTLKAICRNQYDKVSSTLEVGYKFDVKHTVIDMYGENDLFSGFVMNKTSINEFTQTFGEPKETVTTTYLGQEGEARHLTYDWGYAVFLLQKSAWSLVRIEMNSPFTDAPRGVGFGSTEQEITQAYKDFGQLPSQDDTRGLYYAYPNVGQVLINEDGTRTVQYSCSTAASKVWVLEYHLSRSGRVDRMIHYWQP